MVRIRARSAAVIQPDAKAAANTIHSLAPRAVWAPPNWGPRKSERSNGLIRVSTGRHRTDLTPRPDARPNNSPAGEKPKDRTRRPDPIARSGRRRIFDSHDGVISLLAGLFLLLVYNVNGDFLPGNDAFASIYLPVNVLRGGGLSFTYTKFPIMFIARSEPGKDGQPDPPTPDYYLVPSIRTDPVTKERIYINTFGIGSGLSVLPVIATLALFVDDLPRHPAVLWYGAKFAASLLVAASGRWST